MPSIRTKCDVKPLPTSDLDLWEIEAEKEPSWFKTKLRWISQIWTADLVKLFVLLAVSLSHICKIRTFIDVFGAYEQLYNTMKIEGIYMDNSNIPYVMGQLIDYRNNLWMSVGTMCVLLVSTAYFLIMSEKNQNVVVHVMIRIVDLVSMAILVILMLHRVEISSHIQTYMKSTLLDAARRTDVNEFANQLGCSIHQRNGFPDCGSKVLDAFFPIIILKYLIILAILTMAYIGLAYLIEYCIRHWFPPARNSRLAANKTQIQPLVSQLQIV